MSDFGDFVLAARTYGDHNSPEIRHPKSEIPSCYTRPIMREFLWLVILPISLQSSFAMQNTAAGKKLYEAHCAACHGQRGEGGRGARLTTPTRATDNGSLFKVIQEGIPGTEMPPAPLNDREIRDGTALVGSLRQKSAVQVASGPARGEQIYRRSGCAKCHAIGAEGGLLGPDLSNVGRRRVPDYLRRALIEPEADIADSFAQYRWYIVIPDNFLQVRLTTLEGRELTGARV